MIPVTKTFLPPQEEYNNFLLKIWESNQIANLGALHINLTDRLKDYLSVKNLILTANGTLPLQLALRSLAHKGEVITTPFSYIATVSTIVWENCTPVFVDIHKDYLTIDESKIEAAITDKTTAILATHVFGNPCNVEAIDHLAKKYNLRVIYDGAHAFGVKYKDRSIFNYGDVSTCSFHATKLFHTGEGGAIFCKNNELNEELFYRHNFGHDGPLKFQGLGINAKMSELQAGMGLAVLPYIEKIITGRERIVKMYDTEIDFKSLKRFKIREGTKWNNCYYPIILSSEVEVLALEKELNKKKIFPRRYFYPSLNNIPYLKSKKNMEISENVAKKILCLPLYHSLRREQVMDIISIINQVSKAAIKS